MTKAADLSALGSNVTTAGNLSSNSTLTLQTNSTTAITVDSSQRAAFVAGTVSLPAITTTGDTNTGIFFPAADTIAFTEGGVEAMRINSSANVGIGTTSPVTKLHLLTPSATAVALRAGNSASYAEFQVDASGNSQLIAPGGTQIFNTNGAERMRIDSSGNVGIGTTSPAGFGKFAVVGVSGTPIINYNDGTITGTAGYTTGGVAYSGSRSNHPIGFLTNDTERMRIDSTGNVGIGTSSPQAKEDIVFNNTASATPLMRLGAASASTTTAATDGGFINYQNNNRLDISRGWHWTNGANFYSHATTGSCITLDESANILFLNGTGLTAGGNSTLTERMRIDTRGNVLIGTTTSPAGSKELVLGGDYIEGVVAIGTVTSSNTLSLANGTFQTATLTASTACTFTMPTAIAGKSFTLLLKQAAATGNGTATFTSVKWPASSAPTITATAGRMDILTFMSDGVNWYGSFNQNYTP